MFLVVTSINIFVVVKNDEKVVCGTGEGVLNIFNRDEWGNMSDRFTGHPSSVDCIVKLNDSVFLTGCFDGNIRACSIQPNRFIGVIGDHDEFPIQHLCVSSDNKICASISHDECVKFWDVEKLSDLQVKEKNGVKSKTMMNKNVTAKGSKFGGFFSDLAEDKKTKKMGDDSDSDESESDDSSDDDDDNNNNNNKDESGSSSESDDDGDND
jgi:WD40 repeat protein